jgi:outer membrane protein assembly factor BamB
MSLLPNGPAVPRCALLLLLTALLPVFAPDRLPAGDQAREKGGGGVALEVAWTLPLDAALVLPPAYDSDVMYLALDSGRLASVSLTKHAVGWNVRTGDPGSLAAGDGLVFLSVGSTLQAREADGGSLRWQREIDSAVSAPLLCHGGSLLVATGNSRVLRLRSSDATTLWTASLSSVATRLAAGGSALYVSLSGDRLARLDLDSGKRLWEARLAEQPNAILPAGDRVYAGTSGRSFYALRDRNGRVTWRVRRMEVTGSPAADASRIYVLSFDNMLRAVNRNGSLEWLHPLDGRARFGPILFDDLLVVSGRTDIAAVRRSNGTSAWSYQAPHDLTAPVHVLPGSSPNDITLVTVMTTGMRDEVLALRTKAAGR